MDTPVSRLHVPGDSRHVRTWGQHFPGSHADREGTGGGKRWFLGNELLKNQECTTDPRSCSLTGTTSHVTETQTPDGENKTHPRGRPFSHVIDQLQ